MSEPSTPAEVEARLAEIRRWYECAKTAESRASLACTYFKDLLDLAATHVQRIAEQSQELEQWKTWGVVEVAVRNPQVAEYCKHWEERTAAAESQVASLTKERDAAQEEFAVQAQTAITRLVKLETAESQVASLREALRIVWGGVPQRVEEAIKSSARSLRNETAFVIAFTPENLKQIWAILESTKGGGQ